MDRFFLRPHQRRLVHALAHPHQEQEQIFHHLLRRGAQTAFGRAHDLSPRMTLRDYQRAVPVRRYEALKAFVDRAIDGEPDVLWPGTTIWFAESSGTSGPKKQIPISPEAWTKLYQGTGKLYLATLIGRTDRRRFLRGKTIFFVGNVRALDDAGALGARRVFGDVTALSTYLLPWYLDFSRTPDKETTLLPNWETRLQRMAEKTIGENVVHIAGMATWQRRFGQMVLAMTGRRTLREVWPNLLATTVGGVDPTPYLRDLNRLYLGQPENDGSLLHCEVYNGTEGFYALQIDDGDMALLPNGWIFYEFVRRDEAIAGNFADAVPLQEVELEVDYAPILSSINGLWRYLLGDTVRFTAREPYRLRVTGRVQDSINVSGEELLVDVTDDAMRAACERFQLALIDYTATALLCEDADENAVHLWLIELAESAHVSPRTMAVEIDRHLRANAYDYAKARAQGKQSGRSFGLAEPLVLLLPPGSFARWLHHRHGGRVGSQSKVPRLRQDPTLAREVLSLLPLSVLNGLLDGLPPGQRRLLRTWLLAA